MARPRKPTALLEAKGSFDRDPARRRKDPKTTGELGAPPAHLDPARKQIWRELAALLPLGVARNADRFSFELIAGLMHRYRTETLTGSELSSLVSLLSKFGLDPSNRAKVAQPVSTKDDKNPFSEFAS
jgi:phage terminase small subunit